MKKVISIIIIGLLLIGLMGCTTNDSQTDSSTTGSAVSRQDSTAADSTVSTTADSTVSTTANSTAAFENANYVKYVDLSDIVRDKSKLTKPYDQYYVKFIDYIAPNGKPIRIMAADKVTDEQLLKAYNVLSFYLTDYGDYQKAAIANSLADRGALLAMPNGADGDGNTPDAAIQNAQPLYQMETTVAGGKWYQQNDYQHRDAAYEEIFHMVHDYGIGTTQNPAALPELSQQIKQGMEAALPKNKADWGSKGIWGLESKEWLTELAKENSLEQEYIVSGIDSFYGLWQAYTESDKGMWGLYVPKTRQDVKAKDAPAYNIISSFLGDNLTYMERIAPEFEGTFKLYLDKAEPYTFKSQYLQNARLTGDKNSNLTGNVRSLKTVTM